MARRHPLHVDHDLRSRGRSFGVPIAGSAAILLVLLSSAKASSTEAEARASTIFFGLDVGAGTSWINHPSLTRDARVGVAYDVAFGFGLSRAVAVGIELATWQPTNIDGNPAHLHLFAPRFEYTVDGADGLVFASALGVGLRDGSVAKRFGPGGTVEIDWRFPVGLWTTVAAAAGAHAFAYGDGTAVAPFLALALRFYGRSGF